MLERCSNRVISALAQNGMISEDDSEIYRFGLEMLFQKILHYSTMLCLGFLFGMLPQTILFMVLWGGLRIYAGGYHAKSKLACYAMSSSIVPIMLLLLVWLPWSNWLALALSCVSILIILRYAPVGNENKELDAEEKIYYRRKTIRLLIVESAIALISMGLGWNMVVQVITLSFATEMLMLVMSKIQEKKI